MSTSATIEAPAGQKPAAATSAAPPETAIHAAEAGKPPVVAAPVVPPVAEAKKEAKQETIPGVVTEKPADEPIKSLMDDGAPAAAADATVYDLKAEGADKAMIDDVVALARAEKISPTAAQKILERDLKARSGLQEAGKTALRKIAADLAIAAKADPDIGGDRLPQTIAAAHRAVAKYGTPALAAMLKSSHLGSDPEVLRFLANVGRQHATEDGNHGTSSAPPAAETDLRKVFYGSKA